MAEGSARNIILDSGPPPRLTLPWDETQMVHQVFTGGVPLPIGEAFGTARDEFLLRCQKDGIVPPQATFGVELDLSIIPANYLADSLQVYAKQRVDPILKAWRPPYDPDSLAFKYAALEHGKVRQALLRFHELELVPMPDLPEAQPAKKPSANDAARRRPLPYT